MRGAHTFALCMVCIIAARRSAAAEPPQQFAHADIAELTLEQLMQIDVTTVSGSAHAWFKSPAAVYVLTAEDIRRAGALSLAEALRLAPGVFVGRVNSQAYSVGTRGFNGGLGNKTLVLIDGRIVYDPLFSGTFWNVQDVLLEDVDRIEVIRGPGPTLWGANAVNGVINVITKSARDTQGLYISGGGGSEERAFGMVRYGMQLSEDSWIRVYGKYFERDALDDRALGSGHDDWNMYRGGFRFDTVGDDDSFLTIQGDAYHSDRIGEAVAIGIPGLHLMTELDVRDVRHTGGNILFRIGKESAEEASWSLQGYYDHTDRVTNAGFRAERDTFDLEWRHRFALSERHEIMWGMGVRHTRDDTRGGPNTRFMPAERSMDTFSAFVQDTITIVPDRLFAMVGTKVEENDVTGFEFQPSARIWCTPNHNHTLWAAVSRPVRVPSRTEEDSILTLGFADTGILMGGPPSGITIPLDVTGNPGLQSERIWAWEAGYRVRPAENLTLDFAVFLNDYSRLIFVSPALIGPFNNDGWGESYGGEIAATWRPCDNWRVEASYSYVDVQIHGPILQSDEGNTPHHQAQLRSYLDLTDDLELNSALYYVDEVPGLGISDYTRLDVGVTWHPRDNFELSVWGQNLIEPSHHEFSAREVQRGAYIQATFRF
jgi:iron complex outermembrane receptor protein